VRNDQHVAKPDIHPDIAGLSFLLGTWSGRGRGVYPTIEPFDYVETVSVSHVGKPFLAYSQRTFHTKDGRPLHAETGYLRLPRAGWAELVVAHPTGVVEVSEGAVEGTTLRLRSRVVACTGTAKPVMAIERDLEVRGDRFTYDLKMAAVGQPLVPHLVAELRRIP
jgi:THAP4-like, heme-binding beta-barrel domain